MDWLLLGVLPRWANTEISLRGIMTSHGVFSLIIRPLYRDGLSKSSRDRLIVTASAIVASWAAVIGSGSSAASAGRLLPWVRE